MGIAFVRKYLNQTDLQKTRVRFARNRRSFACGCYVLRFVVTLIGLKSHSYKSKRKDILELAFSEKIQEYNSEDSNVKVEKEYILFCDESDKRGKYYSNFYGGLMVGASQYQRITERLEAQKTDLNLFHEVKWEKVTQTYLGKYQELIRTFFEEIALGNIRVRIMFRQNANQPTGLTHEQREMEYFLLYYQFIKHAFGLEYAPQFEQPVHLRLYFDQFPDTREHIEQFKGFLLGLSENHKLKESNIAIRKDDITEVKSHEHALLQCLDIVLGSMSFCLNDKHKDKPAGQRLRGKRTIAKETLYKTILSEIRQIHPRFNIGMSTKSVALQSRWDDPYQHWCFTPKTAIYQPAMTQTWTEKER